MNMKNILKVVTFNIAAMLLIVAVFELFFFIMARSPAFLRKMPVGIRNSVGYLYNMGDRSIIQFNPDCARYDKNLGYTLKPGQCVFSGREFKKDYFINSEGLRDDEESLSRPDVIVTGDSFAMGWGVRQNETIAKVLEKKTGLKVLNAAVASYGTAREMIMLRRLDVSNLKYLIVQYCSNDYEENKEFYLAGNQLNTMSEQEYLRYAETESKPKRYYPGKYLHLKIEKKLNELKVVKKKDEPELDKDEIDLFLNALINGGVDLSKTKIISFVMNGRIVSDNKEFPLLLKDKLAAGNYPPYIKDMIVIDFSEVLKDEHFYSLDTHQNALADQIVAETIAQSIMKHH